MGGGDDRDVRIFAVAIRGLTYSYCLYTDDGSVVQKGHTAGVAQPGCEPRAIIP